jgi:hypothetical protein
MTTTASRSAISLLIALLLAISDAASARADLIAHYAAEDNANDSADGHNGTPVGAVTYGAGKFGDAFQFNGSPYISVPDDPAWTLGPDPFTISVWANFNFISGGGLGSLPNVFVGHDAGPFDQPKWVFFYDGSGHLAFHINGPSGPVFLTPGTTIAPVTAEWHNYAIARNATLYSFYYDGAFLGAVADHTTIPDANAPLTIGQAEGLGHINGSLDDIRIYDTALSPSEIAILQTLPGDFNGDGHVDAADYVTWRKGLGTTYTQADYDVWRAHFGQSAPGAGSGSGVSTNADVPEPATLVLLMLAVIGWCFRRGRAA